MPVEQGGAMAARHTHSVTLGLTMVGPLALLAAAFFFAVPASAQQTETDAQSAEHYFDRLDQKKLGFITLADMQRIEAKTFKRTDDNKDGELTLSEYNFGIPDDRQDVIDRFTRRFRLAD